MSPSTECDRVRLQLMAALDGEAVPAAAGARTDSHEHLASCASCRRWLQDLESMNSRFHGVSYPEPQMDLWARLEGRLQRSDTGPTVTQRLWLIGALVLGWRVLQLVIELPLPMLHPVVPLTGAIAAVWLIARHSRAIETFAPELEKRGV